MISRNPDHVGANHYYIHAVEASLAPDRALPSAKKLETLVPAAGHLVHMPAHTYMRTGDYAGAVTANASAAPRPIGVTSRKRKADGFYPTMYYNHNLDFLASAAMMTGQFAEASKAAEEVTSNVQPMLPAMPMLEPFGAKRLFVLLRFARWNDVLKLPAPDASATHPHLAASFRPRRRARQARRGWRSGADRDAFRTARAIPADAVAGYNPAKAFFAVAEAVLDARIAAAKGDEASRSRGLEESGCGGGRPRIR